MAALDKTSDEFTTPQHIFDALHAEFRFTIDAAATPDNSKLPRCWTSTNSALDKSWGGERVFCNPPYSRGNVKRFFTKALAETRTGDCELAVLLIPTYTEREWFHDNRHLFELRFFKGRLKFGGGATTARGNHCLVIFRSHKFIW